MQILDWLLDSDPSIRWQVQRDLLHAPDEVVAAERARVATEGWGARVLALQAADGQWDGATFSQGWTCTFYSLLFLRELGLPPNCVAARKAVGLVRDHVTWGEQWDNRRFFEGEVEPCINGRVLALGATYGEPNRPLLERLLGEQLEDGGWNCEAPRNSRRSSFHTTICVLDGLLAWEQAGGASSVVTAARRRGEEYLLERRLFRRLSSGEVVDPDWTRFSFPPRWHYDVLRGLDYLRSAGHPPDARVAEAVQLVESKRSADGRWLLENRHPGRAHFEMEEEGAPSRWNTLRALRVLDWYRNASHD